MTTFAGSISEEIPVTSKQTCAADVSAPSHPFCEKGESTTRGFGPPPVRDSLKLASSTSSSASRLRLETNVGGAAYVVEEIKCRHDQATQVLRLAATTCPRILPVPASCTQLPPSPGAKGLVSVALWTS